MKRGWRVPFKDCYRVDEETGCWIWQKALMSGGGYGLKWHDGKFDGAHRVSWLLHKGPIPKGISVLHHCDVKRCVNPKHLFLGTQKENILDMKKKERTTSKLSAKDVIKIRALRKSGLTLQSIGANFGVTKQCIQNILCGRTWNHI